jgi:hypothetical protein
MMILINRIIFVKKLEFDVLPLTKHLEFVRIQTSKTF